MTNVVLSLIIAYLAVVIANGEFNIGPYVFSALVAVAVVLTVMKRFRAALFEATTLACAVFLIAFALRGVAVGSALWWPTKILGWWSIMWLPILILSIAAEALAVAGGLSRHFAATCVAAAGFMIFPSAGSDVITPYHGQLSKVIIAVALVIASAEKDRISDRLFTAIRILGPFVIVTLGWLIVLMNSDRWPVERDLKWLLPVIGLPAAAGAMLVSLLHQRGKGARYGYRSSPLHRQ